MKDCAKADSHESSPDHSFKIPIKSVVMETIHKRLLNIWDSLGIPFEFRCLATKSITSQNWFVCHFPKHFPHKITHAGKPKYTGHITILDYQANEDTSKWIERIDDPTVTIWNYKRITSKTSHCFDGNHYGQKMEALGQTCISA